MLRSLPCERIVAAISYGCIGRSVSVTRTASASRFETARRPAISHLPTLVHPATYIRTRVYGHVYPPASNRSGGRTAEGFLAGRLDRRGLRVDSLERMGW